MTLFSTTRRRRRAVCARLSKQPRALQESPLGFETVLGIPSELVDLSLGGAQAILRNLVKPNQLVRLILPTATGQLICKGRIVWALYEPPGTSLSVYRVGVKFADVDARAVEDFMKDFCEESLMQSQRSSGIA